MRAIYFLVCLLMLGACADPMDGVPKPKDLIPKDSMTVILREMTLLEAHIQTKYTHVSRFHSLMKTSGKKILDKYRITHERFESSMDYYGSRQEEMQSIYTEILDSLNREASMLSKDAEEKDTLRKKMNVQGIGVKPVIEK